MDHDDETHTMKQQKRRGSLDRTRCPHLPTRSQRTLQRQKTGLRILPTHHEGLQSGKVRIEKKKKKGPTKRYDENPTKHYKGCARKMHVCAILQMPTIIAKLPPAQPYMDEDPTFGSFESLPTDPACDDKLNHS